MNRLTFWHPEQNIGFGCHFFLLEGRQIGRIEPHLSHR